VKVLNNILYGVSLQAVAGNTDIEVANLVFDSRQAATGDVFFAIVGTQVDGHKFIPSVEEKNPAAIICERLPEKLQDSITYVQVSNSAEALGITASNYFDNPSAKLRLVGVTGTNGKTSIATLLYNLFTEAGYRSGLLSTISNRIGDKETSATHTTSDAIQINKNLKEMVEAGCEYCFMEVSSHALVQHRTTGLNFTGAIFTNLSHDHLDYHKTFDEYIRAKKLLFDHLPKSAFALVNIDDKRGKVMLQNTRAAKHYYALKSAAEFKAKIISNNLSGLELDVDGMQVLFRIFGTFNAYNLLAVYGAAVLLGLEQTEVLTLVSNLQAAPGRMEQVYNDMGITALVDYAHTPDALTKVLETINEFRSGNEQLITVVGCGGDRDKDKRPLMAAAACELSEKVILTSDNPRSEDPEKILDDMMAGVSPSQRRKALRITEREEAIRTACMLANDRDIILVAGKGHETYQEIKGERFPFDDREVLARMLTLNTN
jgi:UDP-N-acetylmuramoyl-L-alanyl-D-glutamate--2,6-diaminopimelate ligase